MSQKIKHWWHLCGSCTQTTSTDWKLAHTGPQVWAIKTMGEPKKNPIRNDTREAVRQVCSVSEPSDLCLPRKPSLINIQHWIVWRVSPLRGPAATRSICKHLQQLRLLMRPKIPPRLSHGKGWMEPNKVSIAVKKKCNGGDNILMSHKECFLPRATFKDSWRVWNLTRSFNEKQHVKTRCGQSRSNGLVCVNIYLI